MSAVPKGDKNALPGVVGSLLDWRIEDARFDRLNLRTGLFIAMAFVLIAAVIAATLLRQGRLAPTTNLYILTDSAQGLSRGMSVQLSGFKIGTVEDIELEPDARVKTRLVVKTEYMRHITQEAEARLAKEGLIGASFIEIVPGASIGKPLQNDGVLKFERAGDFAQLAEGLADKLHPILDDVKKITDAASDPQGDLRVTLANVRQATASLGELQLQLTRLAQTANRRAEALSGDVGRVIKHADEAVAQANRAVATLGSTLSTLDREIPQTLLRLDRTLSNVEGVTADARRISSGLASDLPPAVAQGRAAVEETREIIDAARRAWPLRTLLPEAREQTLPLDSHDGAGTP